MVKLTDEELKEQIRKHIKKEKEDKADQERYNLLRTQVEVENEWDFWASTKEHRDNFKRWFTEWGNSNYATYQRMVNEYDMPSYHEQKDNPPDKYEPWYGNHYGLRNYRTVDEADSDRKSSVFAWCVTGGVILALVAAIYFLVT